MVKKISEDLFNKKLALLSAMRQERLPWWTHWREVADYFLPRRYVWLTSNAERNASQVTSKSPFILDSSGTRAARTLASGMLNGITSPSRPWFRLRIPGLDEKKDRASRLWLDEVERRMMLIMAETNFYNAMAVMYLDLVVFGTAAMLIYEDFESVFRCYNSALGEYYLAQSARMQVDSFAREISLKVRQIVDRWGIENCSAEVQDAYKQGGAGMARDVAISHLIEPNNPEDGLVAKRFAYRELYWETGKTEGKLLDAKGYHEIPGVFPRWELVANDPYGSSPAMDALPDVIQLQHETKKKAQGLDKMNDPPVLADIQLQHKPTALLPRGITYVTSNSFGAKPIYTVQPPITEISMDIRDIRERVSETFHNDLFRMISQLDTVRSATEIDGRKEEKLVLLGPVLERFENEGLDPALRRIFGIALRAKLIPEPPENIQGADLEIQYVSVLSTAQRAVAAAPTERWVQMIGQVGGIAPSVLNVPDWDELMRDYGADIGVRAKHIRPKEETDQDTSSQREQQQLAETVATGKVAAEGAATLSKAAPGGAAAAIQGLMGG